MERMEKGKAPLCVEVQEKKKWTSRPIASARNKRGKGLREGGLVTPRETGDKTRRIKKANKKEER